MSWTAVQLQLKDMSRGFGEFKHGVLSEGDGSSQSPNERYND